MKTIDQKTQLASQIELLRNKQEEDFSNLKDQYRNTIDSFKPINLIKDSIGDVISTPNLTSNLISGTVGFGINYLTKKFLNPKSDNNKSIFSKALKILANRFIGKKGLSSNA
jgi:F0F1-type ATP synthase assembly protein I